MHIDWGTFFVYLRENRVSLSLYGSIFVTAVIVTMPETPPHTLQEVWTWTRNALSKHFNLTPKPSLTQTETVTVSTATTTDPQKDAVDPPKP